MAVCIALICGLPGSGKSTLARRLIRQAELRPGSSADASRSRVDAKVLCFDELERERDVSEFAMLATADGVPPEVLRWRWSRKVAFERVNDLVASRPEGSALLLLLDDNFYYRSMRHTYFQLARERRCGFVQVWCDVSVDAAQRCNAARAEADRVGSEVITRMDRVTELPFTSVFAWDRESALHGERLGMDPTSTTVDRRGAESELEWRFTDHGGSSIGDLLDEFVRRSRQPPPILPSIAHELASSLSRIATQKSLQHQLDLACRRRIGKCVAAERNAAAKKQLALRLTACRQEILLSSRNGILEQWLAANHPGNPSMSSEGAKHDAISSETRPDLAAAEASELPEFEPVLLALEWQSTIKIDMLA
jgi:predicted kinase